MREINRILSLSAPALDRVFLFAMLLALAAILTIAMVVQYGLGEIPCPLCLLQRFAIFGIHMPVWSIFIALGLLIGFAIRLTFLGGLHSAPAVESYLIRRLTRALAIYVAFICAINFLSVVVQCGMDECHTSGYRLLP